MPVDLSKERIAVLSGGISCEREVSLVSGAAVHQALSDKGYAVRLIDPARADWLDQVRDFKTTLVFIALHGTFGEDGGVQKILNEAGIPYSGSGPEASRRAFDKYETQTLLDAKGLQIPEFRMYRSLEESLSGADSPLKRVVKPTRAGSSVGVTILENPAAYEAACREAFRYSETILVESFVEGRELTVSILGDEALPAIEVKPARHFYDYQAKYQDQGTRYECPARLRPDEERLIRRTALEAYRALGCEIMGRVDLILSASGQPYILEVNTIPGLTNKSLLPKAAAAAGINFTELCERILCLSLNRIAKSRSSVI